MNSLVSKYQERYCKIMDITVILAKLESMNSGELLDELNKMGQILYSYEEWKKLFTKVSYPMVHEGKPETLLIRLIYNKFNCKVVESWDFVSDEPIPGFDQWRE